MDALIGWFSAFWGHLLNALNWILDGFLYVLKAVSFFVFDGLLTIVYYIVSSLDFGSLLVNASIAWVDLPPQLLYLINAIGIPIGLSMLVHAIIIRKLLDLVPASITRL